MGKLIYGPATFDLDDRLLSHLQLVVGLKLRRGEKFFVSWKSNVKDGSGRQSIWVDNGMHLAFLYDGSRPPAVNREWVETLTASANTNFGLQLTDEQGRLLNMPLPDEIGSEIPQHGS